MSGRDRFLQSETFWAGGVPIARERKLDIDEEVESIADQISMLSNLTYQEAYSLVWDAVIGVYESRRK